MERNLVPLTEKEFIELIREREAQSCRVETLATGGIDMWDSPIVEYGNLLFEKIISIYFNEIGRDWIYWWLWEKNGNPDMKAWDENKNEIPLETIHELWEYVKQYLNF